MIFGRIFVGLEKDLGYMVIVGCRICMSQKAEKPVLSGQRIKTRKRDEKEKYDPTGFRDAVIQGLEEAGNDLDAVWKFLNAAGSKLDYRRYGENLFDILIAGGLLVPGGSIATDGDKNLIRRYKYLEKMFEDEMKKILIYIKGFSESERRKLARMTALWLSNGSVPPTVLHVLINEHLIKDNLALDFLLEVFITYKQERGLTNLVSTLKKGGLDGRLMEFVPSNKRTEEHFRTIFEQKGLSELVKLHKDQANQEAKRDLQQQLDEALAEGRPNKEIITDIRDSAAKYCIPEQDVIAIIWATVMAQAEWNKKEELVAEQALKHLKQYTALFEAFTNSQRSELQLMLRIQEFCYGNMNFMKVFHKIILLFYKTDVLSEEVIIKWYNDSHSVKGKMLFLDQMRNSFGYLFVISTLDKINIKFNEVITSLQSTRHGQ
ncbi:UNVERIFIED_CONTAM: hypothetical protein PYX00_007381 [Menopon gallinae]|uniref:W2 domain-containing protein n=1 Tax=Menopon gallinae TaxID=328185 RepID=A0AAW2HIZ3_9NEOP